MAVAVQQTEAVVLHRIPYRETSLIIHTYSRDVGRIDGIVSGVRKKKSKMPAGMFQPGHFIEMRASALKQGALNRIIDAKPAFIYRNLITDVSKSSISFFVGELLKEVLKTGDGDADLYDWIRTFYKHLDETSTAVSNLPIVFMAELSMFLGIQPSVGFDSYFPFIDLLSGVGCSERPDHLYYVEGDVAHHFADMVNTELIDCHDILMQKSTRHLVLQAWMDYYRIHIDQFRPLKSVDILKTIFS